MMRSTSASLRRPTPAGALLAIALVAGLPSAGCESAIKHPAITAGIVGGTLGFATCKLGSDNTAACLAVTGGAAAFLGLVAAAALWLGGDGNSSVPDDEQEQVQPLPVDDAAPPHRRHHPATEPLAEPPAATRPAPPIAAPASAPALPAAPPAPAPATPDPASPPSPPAVPPAATPPS